MEEPIWEVFGGKEGMWNLFSLLKIYFLWVSHQLFFPPIFFLKKTWGGIWKFWGKGNKKTFNIQKQLPLGCPGEVLGERTLRGDLKFPPQGLLSNSFWGSAKGEPNFPPKFGGFFRGKKFCALFPSWGGD